MTLITTLLLFGAAVSVSAETNGVCGNNLTWTFDSGTLTINGSGDMWNWSNDSSIIPWVSYRVTSVVITDGVTSIGDSAFSGCKSLTSISIPNSVTYIGINTFRGCNKLTIYFTGTKAE